MQRAKTIRKESLHIASTSLPKIHKQDTRKYTAFNREGGVVKLGLLNFR
jgi:DNA-directed RNA polymerase subunit H (RpoH/RPB5)